MATTLYIVRHGETEYNRRRIVQGRRIDAPLNETGHAQAAALAARFAEVNLDALYASTLQRAVQTAEAVAAHHRGLAVRKVADLEEMSWGVLDGLSIDAHQPQLQAMYDRWRAGDYGYRIEQGESILEVQQRAVRAVDAIVEAHPGETVMLVAHGRWVRVLLASLLPGYGLARMHEIKHGNTCVNRLTYKEGHYTADLMNDRSHLDAMETTA